MRKAISILLIFTGFLFLLAPFIGQQMIKHYTSVALRKTMDPKNQGEIEDEAPGAVDLDDYLDYPEGEVDISPVEDLSIASIIKASLDFDANMIIGSLLIPDLDVNLPIMEGLTDANLMAGAATIKADQSFGKGNLVLVGHYMKKKDLLFGSLMDIELGSQVYVSDGKTIYEYTVYDTVITQDTAMEMLSHGKAEERGKAIISLMTCYYSSGTGKRFFALGELTDEYPVE